MRHRRKPVVESLESRISLSLGDSPRHVAALVADSPRTKSVALQGTVRGMLTVQPFLFSTTPGAKGSRFLNVDRGRGVVQTLGTVRVGFGYVFEYSQRGAGSIPYPPL